MSKLGYTWYPKDWGNSDAVFELNLSERGLYRELIDMAMLNDNKTISNYKVWQRKWNVEWEELSEMLDRLHFLGLLKYVDQNNNEDLPSIIFIPSCEPRLKLVRGGRNGGEKSRKSKPIPKPTSKPMSKPIPKPTSKQIEKKVNRKEIEIEIKEENKREFFLSWISYRKEIKKEIKSESTLNGLIKKFNSNSIEEIKRCIETSIANGWTGLFWNESKQTEKQNKILDSKPILYFCKHKFKKQRFIVDENGLTDLKNLESQGQLMDFEYEKVDSKIYDKVLAKFIE